jgi:hypothetical protein
MIDALIALVIHSAGDYHGIAPVDTVVCGSTTVPVVEDLSGAVVCEAPQQILASPTLFAPVETGYVYGGSLSPWAGTFGFGRGFGGRFGGGFGGHFGGHHHHGPVTTPVVTATIG